MFKDFYKAMSSQDIKVKCIKADDDFCAEEEYEATYFPPSIFGSMHSSFCIFNHKHMCHYTWEEFHEHFEILTKDFKGFPSMQLEFT